MKSKISFDSLIDQIQTNEEEFSCNRTELEQAYTVAEENTSSLAIKTLSIIGGMLASFAFLGFLLMIGLSSSVAGLISFGVICIGIGLFMTRKLDTILLDTMAISLYAIGCFLIGFGCVEASINETTLCWIFIAIGLISLLVTQNYILSFLVILMINSSFVIIFNMSSSRILYTLFTVVIIGLLMIVFLYEAKLIKLHIIVSKLYSALRIGLLITFIGLFYIDGNFLYMSHLEISQWLVTLALVLSIGYLVHRLLELLDVKNITYRSSIYGMCLLIVLATHQTPAIAASLLIVLLSFYVNYKTGLAIGILALIYFVISYYYYLNISLLIKSLILIGSGFVFLIMYFLMVKKTPTNEEL